MRPRPTPVSVTPQRGRPFCNAIDWRAAERSRSRHRNGRHPATTWPSATASSASSTTVGRPSSTSCPSAQTSRTTHCASMSGSAHSQEERARCSRSTRPRSARSDGSAPPARSGQSAADRSTTLASIRAAPSDSAAYRAPVARGRWITPSGGRGRRTPSAPRPRCPGSNADLQRTPGEAASVRVVPRSERPGCA